MTSKHGARSAAHGVAINSFLRCLRDLLFKIDPPLQGLEQKAAKKAKAKTTRPAPKIQNAQNVMIISATITPSVARRAKDGHTLQTPKWVEMDKNG
jgi:hypothetical protein